MTKADNKTVDEYFTGKRKPVMDDDDAHDQDRAKIDKLVREALGLISYAPWSAMQGVAAEKALRKAVTLMK